MPRSTDALTPQRHASGLQTIHCVSLGCPKNRVDSEVMLGVARRAGYRHVSDPSEAEVIVVNTCGFIEPAKQESIDTILELAEHKRSGACTKLVVTGCLSQRYSTDLSQGMPEVDHFLGSSDMLKLGDVLGGTANRILVGNPADWVMRSNDPRQISTRGASAYLKLAEGCNRSCSFCVIPKLRGKQRSRTIADLVDEAERLAAAGVLELNLVSQDTVAYGRDLKSGEGLAAAVRAIAEVRGIRWVRLFYLYPETLGDELIELIADHPRVVPYVDMPLQHAADAMLRRMRRGHGGARLRALVTRLRKSIPNLTFRTAFIVGHPGETEAEFSELCDFLRFAEFDRVGVFRYSDEAEVDSHSLADKVSADVSYRRARRLMSVQRGISRKLNRKLVGRELEVLVEGTSDEHEAVLVGRHPGQAPEIDGVVYLSGGPVRPGEIVNVEITKATDYDLLGEVLSEPSHDLPRVVPARPHAGPPSSQAPALIFRASDGRRVLRTVPL